MIKPTELKLGNLLFIDGEMRSLGVGTLREYTNLYYNYTNETQIKNPAEMFIGVPLNEEIISELGFKQQGKRKMWIKDKCCVVLADYQVPGLPYEGEKFYIGYKDWGNVIYHTQFSVEYVHELQNAYALTGKELSISF